MERTVDLHALAKDEGIAVWYVSSLTFVKATSEQTGGAFGLIEQLAPVGFQTPYHVHRNEDEAYYLLEGELALFNGNRWIKATAGSYVFLPRNIPNGAKVVGDKPARYLVLATPAGFEQYFIDMGEPATELTLPEAGPPDKAKLASVAASYNIDILGPLPEQTENACDEAKGGTHIGTTGHTGRFAETPGITSQVNSLKQ